VETDDISGVSILREGVDGLSAMAVSASSVLNVEMAATIGCFFLSSEDALKDRVSSTPSGAQLTS